jgi:hypothetical protein
MKKIILTLATLFLLNACSKDDVNSNTPTPQEEQGISAIKIYEGASTTAKTEIVTTTDYKVKYIASLNTANSYTPTSYFIYTGNLITQYYYTLNNTKYTIDIEYNTNSKISKVTSKKGSTTLSIITYTYNNINGKTISQSLIYTNGVVSKTINAEYEYTNGNIVTSTSNDGSIITIQKYTYDANTTNNKNVYSKIVGFDKLIFDYYSNKNPYISGIVTLQDATTLSLIEKRTYRQIISYNANLFPSRIDSYYTYNNDPESSTSYERIEYK